MAQSATASRLPQPQLSNWKLDAAHTHVGFTVRHMMFTWVKGNFSEVTGDLVLGENDVSQSQVRVSIPVGTIDTSVTARDEHLRGPDFFDVAQYPTITFESKRVESARGGKLRVIGDLTIRGVTREVALEAKEEGRGADPWGNQRVGFSAETRIDRRDFGLRWNQALETGGVLVGDEVRITIDAQAVSA